MRKQRPYCLAIVACLLVGEPLQAQDGGSVIVWKRIATATDPATIVREAAHALPSWATTRGTEAVQTFVSRIYKLDPAAHAAQLATIADKVAALNGVSQNTQLPANSNVVLPLIARALSGGARSVPFMSVDLRGPTQVQGSISPKLDHMVKLIGQATSGFAIAIREMVVGQAERALEEDPDLQILSAPWAINEAAPDDLATGPPFVPGAAEIAMIQTVGSLPVQQHPTLFIVDSYSPDRAAEERTRTFVLTAIASLRRQAGLPPMALIDPQCAAGDTNAGWSEPPADGARPAHTVRVRNSLIEFQTAAGASVAAPQVIFVPMLRRSSCEIETLRQIIELHYLMTKTGGDRSKRALRNVADGFTGATDKVLARLGTVVGAHGEVNTDTEVGNAILYLASAYAAQTGDPIFTAMPWTFGEGPFDPIPPADSGGLYVVASGNYGKTPTIEANHAQFTLRSIEMADTLAVMNVGRDGLLMCGSTIVTATAHAFVTSFYGAIPGDCGTSFSAPRVAWLLAFREAVRPRQGTPAALATTLRNDPSISGTLKSEGGGTVLDLGIFFKNELHPAAPVAPVPIP